MEKVKNFFALYDEIAKGKDRALIEVSECDKELSELYHEIEGMELGHIAKSHKKLKELQILLRRRREVKGTARIVQSFADGLSDKIEKMRQTMESVTKQHQSVIDEIQEKAKIQPENLQK